MHVAIQMSRENSHQKMDSINGLKRDLQNEDQEYQELEKRIDQLSISSGPNAPAMDDAQLADLKIENSKLKYRLNMLKRKFESLSQDQNNDDQQCMTSCISRLECLFKEAISKAFPNIENPPVSLSVSNKADYQCNSVMQISKIIKKDPTLASIQFNDTNTIAEKIMNNIPMNHIIGKLELVKPGFLNITISEVYLKEQIQNIIKNGIIVNLPGEKYRVVVDYSSPNIAKEMHVGHLRSTIIGDCLANILEFLGHHVIRINHVGDWGTQFGMLLAHLVEKYPNFMTEALPIDDLQGFYKESKQRFDEDEEFKKRAYQCVVKLQSKEKEMLEAWKKICDISRKSFEEIYNKLDIRNLTERGESYYQDLMVAVVKELENKDLLENDENRKIMFKNKSKVPPLTIVKSDGGFTYDTSDMACIKHRVQEEKAKRIIYVTDAGQAAHFTSIFENARAAEIYDPTQVRVDHVGFGVVLGEDKKKFKTRSGETVRLKDLLEEGLQRSLAKLIEKGRDKELSSEELKAAQVAVAFGCIKYADLSHDRNREYEFSFDRMLDDKGNTAVYLLYSLTRIRSIVRKANLPEPLSKLLDSTGDGNNIKLDHPKEINLAKSIIRFPEVLLKVADELYPHLLCSYLFDLSVSFSEFYENCYCIEKTKTATGEEKVQVIVPRILLCHATSLIFEKGFSLLGIRTVGKM